MSIESGSTPMQPASAAVATPVLDPGITLALAQAADAAYQDFARQPLVLPDGWALAGRWTGWDPTPLGGSEEAYGLALRRVDAPSELIFAFRGTASLDDALDDADFPQVEFVASDGAASEGGVRTGARVAAGFYGIYSDTGPGMSQPMRAQLLGLLKDTAPTRIWVTGHSLGGALAQLFAFDLSYGPHAEAFDALIVLASPRVGDAVWRDTYQARIPLARSIRIYNQHDIVPQLPPKELGFHDVGLGFPTAFQRSLLPALHPVPRHSLLNLSFVLRQALPAQPQVWAGRFVDQSDPQRWMLSTAPHPPAG